jgi:hypothetical protein
LILAVTEIDGIAHERRVVLGGKAQQRQLVVIVEPRARGGIEVAIGDRRVAEIRHQQEQHRNVDRHVQRDAVRIRRRAPDRRATQLAQQAFDARSRLSAERTARGRALAHEVEAVATRRPISREPDVRRTHRIGAVENQAAQSLRMPGSERLSDERAIAVAVEVDFLDLQCVQHRRDIVYGEMRAV